MIICSPQLGLSPESNLGGEVYDREMLKALDNMDVETLILLPFGKKHPVLKHAKFFFLPVPFVYPPWLFNLLILPYLFYLHHKFKFNILRIHSPYFVGPATVLFHIFKPEVKLVPTYLHLEDNKLYSLVDKLLLPHCSLVTAISKSTKQELIQKFKVSPKQIVVTTPGVDEKYRPQPRNQKLLTKHGLENQKVLLYLGQLIARKNIPFLFELVKKLPVKYSLLICGSGPFQGDLEQIVHKLNLSERVLFAGTVPEAEKVDYYNLADIFLYPSSKEGFGLSVCEALSCGKTVIASDIPAFREIHSTRLILHPLKPEVWINTIFNTKKTTSNQRLKYTWKTEAEKYLKSLTQL